MFSILKVVAQGFGKDDSLTNGMTDPSSDGLLAIIPKQVLPFQMDLAGPSHSHHIAGRVQGSLKMLLLVSQALQLANGAFCRAQACITSERGTADMQPCKQTSRQQASL